MDNATMKFHNFTGPQFAQEMTNNHWRTMNLWPGDPKIRVSQIGVLHENRWIHLPTWMRVS